MATARVLAARPTPRLDAIHHRHRPCEALESRLHLAAVPPGFADNAAHVSGLAAPTSMEFAPDGRIFVTQQGGALRVVKNGALLATPFATVNTNFSGERGLLGVTFDPNFTANGHVYVYYTCLLYTSPSPRD